MTRKPANPVLTGCCSWWKDHQHDRPTRTKWLHRLYRPYIRGRTRTYPVSESERSTSSTPTRLAPPYSLHSRKSQPIPANPANPSPRKWRESRTADLTRRDAASAKKKSETIAQARRDIDEFYESYNRKSDKQKAETARQAAEFIQKREDTTAGGTSWERIARLADLSGKGQGGGGEGSTKKRMREILLDLKNDPKAPGVGGV